MCCGAGSDKGSTAPTNTHTAHDFNVPPSSAMTSAVATAHTHLPGCLDATLSRQDVANGQQVVTVVGSCKHPPGQPRSPVMHSTLSAQLSPRNTSRTNFCHKLGLELPRHRERRGWRRLQCTAPSQHRSGRELFQRQPHKLTQIHAWPPGGRGWEGWGIRQHARKKAQLCALFGREAAGAATTQNNKMHIPDMVFSKRCLVGFGVSASNLLSMLVNCSQK